jgi:NADH:ubiquinone oxidoreductase subunit C
VLSSEILSIAELPERVEQLLQEDARIAMATCLDLGDQFEVIYHFNKGLELINLRVRIDRGEELPSISHLTLNAALIENEMREFFGINITDIAIDFKGGMLLAGNSPKAPMLKSLKI